MGENNTQAKIMGVLNFISPETLIKTLVKSLKKTNRLQEKKTGWLQGTYDEELTAMNK